MAGAMPRADASFLKRALRRVRPSYLVLLALVPLVVYLFVASESYQAALRFILPGLGYTISVALLGYVMASLLGLVLAGMLLLRYRDGTPRTFLIAVTAFALASTFFFLRPASEYVLIGDDEGIVAIAQGTPADLVATIRAGGYAPGAPTRSFRSVPDPAAALDRLESGRYGAAFVPSSVAPDGYPVLWEVSFLPDGAQNGGVFFAGLAAVLLLLAVAGWLTDEHPLAIFAELYVDLIRGIPMLVVILFIGFVLPPALRDATNGLIEIQSDLARGVVAIGLGYAAYMAEIFRAGIEAIPKGQIEASRSLGLSGWQTARYVVLPQAIRIVLPPLGNEFIAMLKDTALLSVIGIGDVTRKAREFGAANLDLFPPYNTAAVIYVALTLSASSLLKWLERRARVAGD